jgi:deoxyribodipyrimidine photolyase
MSFNLKFWKRGDASKKVSSRKIGEANKKDISPEEEAKKSQLKSEIRESNLNILLNMIIGNKQLQKTKEEIHKMYEHYYNKWRDYDLLTCILSILGLVVAIVDVI